MRESAMKTTAMALATAAWMAATAAWAQGPTLPERKLQHMDWTDSNPDCAALRGGGLATVVLGATGATARTFDGLGDPSGVVVTLAAQQEVGRARVAARDDGFVAVWNAQAGVRGQMFSAAGARVGPEIAIAGSGHSPEVVGTEDGGFVATWVTFEDGIPVLYVRRVSAAGVGGSAFRVSTAAGPYFPFSHPPARAADGSMLVAWYTGVPGAGILARRLAADGSPLGPELVVSPDERDHPGGVAAATDGSWLVVRVHDRALIGRRYDALGAPFGPELQIAAAMAGPLGVVATAGDTFTVAWYDDEDIVRIRTIGADGSPRGPASRVAYSPRPGTPVSSDTAGGFALCWVAYDATSKTDYLGGRRYAALAPAPSVADPEATAFSNGNGVLEPFERAAFRPAWRNYESAAHPAFTGEALAFQGPGGPLYSIYDSSASYGAADDVTSCSATGDCYELGVVSGRPRPSPHWDATLDERLSTGQLQRWRVHVGESFLDVPVDSPYYRFTETLLHQGVTAGCRTDVYGHLDFCPSDAVTREQITSFVLVALEGPGYRPLPIPIPPPFTDVPLSNPYFSFILELVRRGVVSGCAPGAFCPSRDVTRAEAAVIVLRTLDPELAPPACGTPVFQDVPASSPFCPWVEELARRGVVGGCAPGFFCPDGSLTRQQMAVVLTQAFGLTLYAY